MHPSKVKRQFIKKYFKQVLTYKSEIWTYTRKELNRIQATEMKFLRGMVHKTDEIGYVMTKSGRH